VKSFLVPNKTRKWQVVLMDARPPFWVSQNRRWQMLLGPDSGFTTSEQVAVVGLELSAQGALRVAGYLLEPRAGTIGSAASCTFKIFRIVGPSWEETLVRTVAGSILPTGIFFATIPAADYAPIDLANGDTLMVEAAIDRLGEIHRERRYINNLGIHDSLLRLKNKVTFLELTKADE